MLARGIDFWAKKEGYDRIFTGENYNLFHQFPCYLSGECILFANLESQFSKKANEKVENMINIMNLLISLKIIERVYMRNI